MNDIAQAFDFNDNPVRTLMIDGEPWFVAKDICKILLIKDVSQALSKLEDDEKNTITLHDECAGNPVILMVSEFGAYALIMRSRKQGTDGLGKKIYALIMRSRKQGTDGLGKKIAEYVKGSRIILNAINNAINNFEMPEDIGEMYVYAIREKESKRIKLGISRDPYARLKQMQTENSQELELVAYQKSVNRFQDEAAIHAENAHHHIRREWSSKLAAN